MAKEEIRLFLTILGTSQRALREKMGFAWLQVVVL
jgi:hypothetical protein